MMDGMIQALESSFRTKRLVLRPLDNADKDFIHAAVFSDPVVSGLGNSNVLQPINKKTNELRTDGIISNSLLAVIILLPAKPSEQDEKEQPHLFTPDGFERIGFLCIDKSSPNGVMDFRTTSIGLSIATKQQGKGYGRETIDWALSWIFDYANLHRVEISSLEFNERALALYKKIGFVEEGRQRKCSWFNGKWWDKVQLAMLDEEYYEMRRLSEHKSE